jgi:hypothetical protein
VKRTLTALVVAPSAFAASAMWTGREARLARRAPVGQPAVLRGNGDAATFNNAANGNTTLNFGTGVTVMTILFDTQLSLLLLILSALFQSTVP